MQRVVPLTWTAALAMADPYAEVRFRHNSSAASAEFTVHGGRIGPSNSGSASGYGGQVTFYDQSSAATAHIRNYGEDEYHGGTGAYTQFFDSSTAENAVIENFAATQGAGGSHVVHQQQHGRQRSDHQPRGRSLRTTQPYRVHRQQLGRLSDDLQRERQPGRGRWLYAISKHFHRRQRGHY